MTRIGTDVGKYLSVASVVEGWANLLMAMENCESVAEPGGPAVSDTAMYQLAITKLANAMTVAQGANQTAYKNFAQAGKARAELMVGKYAEALTDAQAVPDGFFYYARFSDASSQNSFVTLNHYPENKAAGLDSRRWAQVDTTNANGKDYFIDKWSGMPDPRIPILFRVGNRLGVDGHTLFFSQDKYKTRNDDIILASWREMRLIEAEVYWHNGDFPNAIASMNKVRHDVGLPDLTNPGTSQGVLDRLLEERFATLFLEAQRANDLYRFNLFPSVIGTGYSTKAPLNGTEATVNPNISLPRTCPRLS